MKKDTFNVLTKLRRAAALLLAAAMPLTAGVSCGNTESSSSVGESGWRTVLEDEDTASSLESFLDCFAKWYASVPFGDWQYDCSEAADGSGSILACIVAPSPCVDWSVFSDVNRYDRFIEKADDPKRWASETISYYRYDTETVEFIASEIFNVSREDIDKLAEKGENSRMFYRQGDFYYSLIDENLDSLIDAKVYNVKPDGDRYSVKFIISGLTEPNDKGIIKVIYRDCTAEMELKTVNGSRFWSLYRFDSVEL